MRSLRRAREWAAKTVAAIILCRLEVSSFILNVFGRMRWRHAILPVTTACGAMLCVVAILAFGPAAYAQGPGIKPGDSKPANKPDDKKPGDGKATDAKDAPKDSDI